MQNLHILDKLKMDSVKNGNELRIFKKYFKIQIIEYNKKSVVL